MEPALDLGLEMVPSAARRGAIRIAGSRRVPAVKSRLRGQQPRRNYHQTVIGSPETPGENTWADDSDFANRPPIDTPDELIFPACVFCGYGRSYEPEFGTFKRMSFEAEIYCHEGCAIEDMMLDERGRERPAQ